MTEIADDRSVDLDALGKVPGVKLAADASAKRMERTLWRWEVTFPEAAPAA